MKNLMLKILFFGKKSRDDVWEHDFILNEVLPEEKEKSVYFLTLEEVRETNLTFDIFVYGCRDPQTYSWGYTPSYDETLECIIKTKPKIVIQLSDEFEHEDLQSHNNLGNHCKLFLRQHHHPNYAYTNNTLHIPLGYYNDFILGDKKIPSVINRSYNWCFVGYKKADREECINRFSTIENGFVNLQEEGQSPQVTKEKLVDIYLNSIFSPATRGWTTLNPNRLYEASMCGCIPVVVGTTEEIENTFKYEENPPWIFSDSWENAVNKCQNLLHDPDKLQEIQKNILTWWEKRISNIKNKVNQVLLTNKKEGMKIVQVGSNKGNDDLSNHLFLNHKSIDFGLFVEANPVHIDDLKRCYEKYPNAIIENIAVKLPSQHEDKLTIHYHTSDPDYKIASCNIDHIKKHMQWPCNFLHDGEIKSFEVACLTLDQLLEKYSITDLDWLYLDVEGIDAEILLTFDWKKYSIKRVEFEYLHLGHYSDAIKNMMIGMGYKQVNALHEYDWAFEKDEKDLKNKLKNFPSVNFISIEEAEDRRELLYEKFSECGFKNITAHIYEKYREGEYTFINNRFPNFLGGRGPLTSHLISIKDWYFDTDEEYAFFCEDDISFESVKYWNFTWDEFFNNLPPDWECVQLSWVREDMFCFSVEGVELRNRCWCDWSACAYLMKRSHAKKIISNYYRNGEFVIDYIGDDASMRPDWALVPTAETIIFSNMPSKIYSFPLFVEDVLNCETSMSEYNNRPCWINENSYHSIMNWWSNIGKNLKINDIIKIK